MQQYMETIATIGRPEIKITEDNGVKIFHMPFREKGISITDSGKPCSQEEFDQALRCELDLSDRYHAHNCFFLVYVISGCNLEIVEGKPIMVTENDLLMLTPYTQHFDVHTEGSEIIFFHIDPLTLFHVVQPAVLENILFSDFFSDFLVDHYVRNSLLFQDCIDTVRFYLDEIIREYIDEQILYQSRMQYLFAAIIIQLARKHTFQASHFSDAMTDRMKSVLQYITDHYKDVTLDTAAKHFGYHPAYLSRRIRQYSGRTFSQLLTDYKLARAALLIREHRLSIEEVAFACGYNEPSTFYKAFTKKYHCAPRSLI